MLTLMLYKEIFMTHLKNFPILFVPQFSLEGFLHLHWWHVEWKFLFFTLEVLLFLAFFGGAYIYSDLYRAITVQSVLPQLSGCIFSPTCRRGECELVACIEQETGNRTN